MNDKLHQEAVKEAVKKKFRGKQPLKSKVIPHYPASAEREFQRVTNGYMRLLNETLKEHLPKMMALYKKERHGDSRYDDIKDIEGDVRYEFQKVAEELEQKIAEYGLEAFVEKIAKMSKNKTLHEWKRVVHETLGIDLLDDYYKGDFYARALKKWTDENVTKIKTIPGDTLGEMREIIITGYKNGLSIRELQKQIQIAYGTSKHKAAMLARDQIASLNAEISEMQQRDAGVKKYRWSDSHDSRVRDCHHALNGQTFSWDDPPEMWYKTKKDGVVMTGRRCHPGQDYCCRCVAIPVFDIETLNIPMK